MHSVSQALLDHLATLFCWWIAKLERRHTRMVNEQLKRAFRACGRGVRLHGRIRVTGANRVEIGDNVHIGDNAFIRAEGGLTIGDNTHISRNLVLYTINHSYEGERLPYDDRMELKPVHIGRNVWIGMNVCVAPGSTIGDGAIVGMGTTVSGDVPPLSIVCGQKWRVIHWRDEQHYLQLDLARQYGGADGREPDTDP